MLGNENPQEDVFIFPASFAQYRLWFIDQLLPGNYFYNVPTALRLQGKLNINALKRTLAEIIQRHETLRTTFQLLDGELVQTISPSGDTPLTVCNLEGFPPQEREKEAIRKVLAESQRPFNLATEPLMRSLLLYINESESILVLNLHHIVCDDWSIGVLIRELTTLYPGFCNNQPSPLPELPLQYADFAEWQREWLQGERLETQLRYWRSQLQSIAKLNLPTDYPKTKIQTYQGASQPLELSPSLTQALEEFSQKEKVTLFMTLLAAFQTLLYRYTHSEDIAVGSPIANRNRSEIEGLIGFFVNTLVLRTHFSDNPTFHELLHRVKEVTLGAYAHQDLPFEKLVEELQPERNLSESPFFSVVFGFENTPMTSLQLPELEITSLNIEIQTTRFDLEFHLWKSSEDFRNLWGGNRWHETGGIRGLIVYNTDLFEAETISRLLAHFQKLLEGILAKPSQPVANLPLLTPFEEKQLESWNHTHREYPDSSCIHHLFSKQVTKTPHAVAVTFPSLKGNSFQTLTYQELHQRSNQLAHYLQKKGVTSGVLVGICLKPSVEMIIGLLAILKAGGAYLPLDASYPSERLNFMLEDTQAAILLTHSSLASLFNIFTICVDTEEDSIAKESNQTPITLTTAENLAYVIYTSGSTGTPKGVAVSHKAVNRLVCNSNYISIQPTDTVAQVANIAFDAATFEIWGALLNGAQLVGILRETLLSPSEFARQIQQQQISILFLTTALFQQMARNVPTAFASLRYLLFGGETVDSRWVRKVFSQGAPENFLHVYGPTENTTFSTYYRVEDLPEAMTSVPIGRAIANTQIHILDSHLQPVPIGVIGELYIGGDGLAQGYLNRPELTAECFIPNPFLKGTKLYKTGDKGRYLANGNIEFLGRWDQQVKIRGFRIELGEIEAVLCQHPAVAEAIVIVREEIPEEKQLVAYLVSSQEVNTTELHSFLQQKLPAYMLPMGYGVLEAFPLTPNGKINRSALPAVDALSLNIENYIAPRSDIESQLVAIWKQVLGKEKIGIQDNFFELGGHSLMATQLISRIRDRFSIELPVASLFESPTVAGLARHIETLDWVTQSSDRTSSQSREEIEF